MCVRARSHRPVRPHSLTTRQTLQPLRPHLYPRPPSRTTPHMGVVLVLG